MRNWKDVELEDILRDKVECTSCKVDVHTFFGDSEPTVVYNCMHHDNCGHRCAYYGNIQRCPIINDVKSITETTTYYEEILNKFEKELTREENKYPLTDREKIFAETIKEILNVLNYTR